MNTDNLYIFLFVFFIILIITYVFGMGMINLIDSRISSLNNNSSIKIHESFSSDLPNKSNLIETNETLKSGEIELDDSKSEQLLNGFTQLFEKLSSNKKIGQNKLQIPFKTNFDQEFYQNMNKNAQVEGFSNSESEKAVQTWELEKKNREICQMDHIHKKDRSNINCSYGVTNYADPKDLSAIDLKIFMLNYPTNITMQDYINWLYCFKDRENELPYNHLKNLKKLKRGIELVEEHGVLPPPSYYYPPLNAKDYYDKLYDESEISIAPPLNSITSSMQPYNADEYAEFSQNFDVKGSTGELRNNDIAIKKNTQYVNDYVNGYDSFRIKETEEYNKFRRKKVEN